MNHPKEIEKTATFKYVIPDANDVDCYHGSLFQATFRKRKEIMGATKKEMQL